MWPLPDVLPRPEPGPRPTRFFARGRALAGPEVVESVRHGVPRRAALDDFDEVADLVDLAAERRGVGAHDFLPDAAEAEAEQRLLLVDGRADARLHLADPKSSGRFLLRSGRFRGRGSRRLRGGRGLPRRRVRGARRRFATAARLRRSGLLGTTRRNLLLLFRLRSSSSVFFSSVIRPSPWRPRPATARAEPPSRARPAWLRRCRRRGPSRSSPRAGGAGARRTWP